MQALEFLQGHRFAGTLTDRPAHAMHGAPGFRGEIDQAGIEGRQRKELLRPRYQGLVGFGRADRRHGAGGADGDEDLVASQLGHVREALSDTRIRVV